MENDGLARNKDDVVMLMAASDYHADGGSGRRPTFLPRHASSQLPIRDSRIQHEIAPASWISLICHVGNCCKRMEMASKRVTNRPGCNMLIARPLKRLYDVSGMSRRHDAPLTSTAFLGKCDPAIGRSRLA